MSMIISFPPLRWIVPYPFDFICDYTAFSTKLHVYFPFRTYILSKCKNKTILMINQQQKCFFMHIEYKYFGNQSVDYGKNKSIL